MLDIKIPFYGKRGSINRLVEENNIYNISTYNIDGKVNEDIIQVKKSLQNKKDLLKRYYNDVYEYLNVKKEEYERATNEKSIELPNTKVIENIFVITAVLATAPLISAFILGSYSIWMLGMNSITIGLPFAIAAMIILKKIDINNKRKSFIREYSKLKNEYAIYREDNKIKENTNVKVKSITPISRDKELSYSYVKKYKN